MQWGRLMVVFLCQGLIGLLVDVLEDLKVIAPCCAMNGVVFGVRTGDVILN